MTEVKEEVRQFYDEVGWQLVGADVYQNARYEDLRPVSRQYIHDCHLRVARHLRPQGRYLLDAGSGPVQYPEYLEYSRNYQYRVCADISITALKEARRRLGEHGLIRSRRYRQPAAQTRRFRGCGLAAYHPPPARRRPDERL